MSNCTNFFGKAAHLIKLQFFHYTSDASARISTRRIWLAKWRRCFLKLCQLHTANATFFKMLTSLPAISTLLSSRCWLPCQQFPVFS